jgi:hypothetical protein
MSVDWTSVFQSVGIFGVGSGVLGWLVKTLVAQGLSKDLEAYKAALARETEKFKVGLEAVEFEHRTKFSKLHDRVEAAVIDLNDKFFDAARSVAQLSWPVRQAGDPSPEYKLFTARQRYGDANDACKKHELFFSPEVEKLLIAALGTMWAAINLHETLLESPFQPDEPRDASDLRKEMHNSVEILLRDQLWPVMERLREEFRRHLGVKSSEEPLPKDVEKRS